MTLLRKSSLGRVVKQVARLASLQPVQGVEPQMNELIIALAEPAKGPMRREILDKYRAYLRNGWREGRSPHPLFDEVWYADRYPDVRAAGIPGLVHYLRYGWREGRSPHPLISDALLLESQ